MRDQKVKDKNIIGECNKCGQHSLECICARKNNEKYLDKMISEEKILAIKEELYSELSIKIDYIAINERLSYIEKHLRNFINIINDINKVFRNGVTINVNETAMDIINPIKQILEILNREACDFRRLTQQLESDSVLSTLKFMAKQISQLTHEVKTIKEDGLKKSIHLDLTMDGYEMVKRKLPKIEDDIPEQEIDPEESLKDLLKTLTKKEQEVIIHRYGLFGQKQKTLAATGKLLNFTRERIILIQKKALFKLRQPSRKTLAKNITHLELRRELFAED